MSAAPETFDLQASETAVVLIEFQVRSFSAHAHSDTEACQTWIERCHQIFSLDLRCRCNCCCVC